MDELIKACQGAIEALSREENLTRHEVDQLKSKFLGKKSEIAQAYQKIGNLAPEEKKAQGKQLNDIRTALNLLIQHAYEAADQALIDKKVSQVVDVSAVGRIKQSGSLHPLSIAYQEIEAIFRSLGFEIASGPQIEDDYHNFTALNFPADHPARAMHDTFYLKNVDRLLRTHTSTVQIHMLNKKKPPLRIATPGCVYRCDHDPTHSPMFNQVECLVVEKGCNFAQLKWLLVKVCEAYLGRELEYRFRPSFFSLYRAFC